MIEPATAILIGRFLHDSALLLLWGSAAFLAFLTPARLASRMWKCLGMAPLLAAVICALTTAVMLPLQAASIGEGWSDAISIDTLDAVLLESSIGTAWQAQVIAAILLLLAFLVRSRHRMTAIAITSALATASLALNGHASNHQGWLSALHRSNDILHMLSGGAWLGALFPLVFMLRELEIVGRQPDAQIALRRFSLAGHIGVALVLTSGVINTCLVLGRLPTDWTSPYQRLLAIKIAAVCIMICLAITNRYFFVPAIAMNSRDATRSIRLASMMEIALGIAVIGLVAIFGMLDPG